MNILKILDIYCKRQLEVKNINIPDEYFDMEQNQKDEFLNDMIDTLFVHIDRTLPIGIDRLNFLKGVLESSLVGSVETEHYEAAAIIRDIIEKIDE